MNKVEELTDVIRRHMALSDGSWSEERLCALDDLLDAIRDEDFAIHMAEKKCCTGDYSSCESCPAAGTRYCP